MVKQFGNRAVIIIKKARGAVLVVLIRIVPKWSRQIVSFICTSAVITSAPRKAKQKDDQAW